jgi:hypothetical protein
VTAGEYTISLGGGQPEHNDANTVRLRVIGDMTLPR